MIQNAVARAWRRRGALRSTRAGRVFVADLGGTHAGPTILVLHGAPTSSFDWHRVAPALASAWRVVLFDYVGSGFSDKPDRSYDPALHADTACEVMQALTLERVVLVVHDLGATVAGELMRRAAEGLLDVRIAGCVVLNASLYRAHTQFTSVQRALLAQPDAFLATLAGVSVETRIQRIRDALAGFMADPARVPVEDLDALAQLVVHADGDCLLPRTIRYIEHRLRDERRYAGVLEAHVAPVAAIWGAADPLAPLEMVTALRAARPSLGVTLLEGVGHFPMLEAPSLVTDALQRHFAEWKGGATVVGCRR